MFLVCKEEGLGLVIVLVFVICNWVREIVCFVFDLMLKLLGNSKEVDFIDEVGLGDLFIISYGLLFFVEEVLMWKFFGLFVLDEV